MKRSFEESLIAKLQHFVWSTLCLPIHKMNAHAFSHSKHTTADVMVHTLLSKLLFQFCNNALLNNDCGVSHTRDCHKSLPIVQTFNNIWPYSHFIQYGILSVTWWQAWLRPQFNFPTLGCFFLSKGFCGFQYLLRTLFRQLMMILVRRRVCL